MKTVILISLAFFNCHVVFSQENDFRAASWGASLTAIKGLEKAHFVMKVKDLELVYHDVLDGEDCQVSYIFNGNDKLGCGLYHFTKKYNNLQLYVDDYNKFKSLLVEKYGMFVCESENWSSNAVADDKQNLGQAIADGKLSLKSIWHTGRSVIKIELSADANKQPVLQIHYSAKSWYELENPADLKAAVGKL